MRKFLPLFVLTLVFALTAGKSFAAPEAPIMTYMTQGLSLSISWNEVPDATDYTLYYAPYPYAGPGTVDSLQMGTETSFEIDLWDGAAYYIAVTSSNLLDESEYSNVEFFVITTSTPDAPVLSTVTDGLGISLSWTEIEDAIGYKLYYASDSDPDTFNSLDVGDKTEESFYLWEGAAYYLKVTGYNSSGLESEPSNTEYFVMGPPTPEWVDDDEDGFLEVDGDCDDTDPLINPAAEDICEDGIDQDCSSTDATCEVMAVEEPFFTPAPGEFNGAQLVTLSTATSGATIYYTTDGTTPTVGSNIYTSALNISTDQTIKAIAVKDGLDTSEVASGEFLFVYGVVATSFSPRPGTYDSAQSVTLASPTPGTTIYYTTDGTTPTKDSTLYELPLMVSTSQTITAIATKEGMLNSTVATAGYTITNQAFAPTFSPGPDIYYVPPSVSLSTTSDGAKIRYTTDGSTPTSASTLYTGPLTVSSTQTINAIAVKPGIANSQVTSGSYTIRTVAGVWALRMVTGSNSCGQTVGEETILGDVTVTQSGSNITVTSQLGSESGTLQGNTLNWNMSYPVNDGNIDGTLSISMRLSLSGDGDSFSGPVDFTFTGSPISCNGTGTVYGSRK